MSSVVRPTRPRAAVPRRLHLLLRDGTAIEGVAKVGADQSLVAFLNARPGWMTLTQARRARSDDPEGFMIVHAEHIIMASAPDGKVSVQARTATAPEERIVEFVLLGGRTVRGYLPIAPGQRLGDAVAAAGGRFVALSLARLFPEETDVGDIAIQTGALAVVRDLRPSNSAPEPE
jgi:hypothetical protein